MDPSELENGNRRQIDDRRQYKGKQVCYNRGYTGHPAKYGKQRQRSASPYRQKAYDKQTQNETRSHRQEMKGIMKELLESNSSRKTMSLVANPSRNTTMMTMIL